MIFEDKFHDQNDKVQRLEYTVYKRISSLWTAGKMYPIYDLMFGYNSDVAWMIEQEVKKKLEQYGNF